MDQEDDFQQEQEDDFQQEQEDDFQQEREEDHISVTVEVTRAVASPLFLTLQLWVKRSIDFSGSNIPENKRHCDFFVCDIC